MTEEEVVAKAKGLHEGGETKASELVGYLHRHGLSAGKAIRAMKEILGVSLKDAKTLVAQHPDYESVIRVGERLQAALRTEVDPKKALIDRFAELQNMFHHLRSYSGPFDPQFPRTIFHMIFGVPLHCSIDPVETYGVLQRLFRSKDGKYLSVSFSNPAKFWRADPTEEDVRALEIMRLIRAIAKQHNIWATYVDASGSWFPKYSYMPGMLQPTPGDPIVVPFDEYLKKISEYDLTDPPMPGALLSTLVDADTITRTSSNSELVTELPPVCRVCANNLVACERDGYFVKNERSCPSCRITYIREPLDSELSTAESKRRDERQAVMNEFLKRIAEEFKPVEGKSLSPQDILGDGGDDGPNDPYGLFGEGGESWRGES